MRANGPLTNRLFSDAERTAKFTNDLSISRSESEKGLSVYK